MTIWISINFIIFYTYNFIQKMDKVSVNDKSLIYLENFIAPSQLSVYKKQDIIKMLKSNYSNSKNQGDELFPPEIQSLIGYSKNETLSQEDLESYLLEKTWHRIIEIFDDFQISKSNFSPYDIKQGALGDCYFLSAIAALAKFPRIIQNLFVFCDLKLFESLMTKNSNNEDIISQIFKNFTDFNDNDNENLHSINNYYRENYEKIKMFFIKIRVHGEWKLMTIDDFLPTYNHTANLVFAKSSSSDLWVPLIEKIWAKLLRGYYRTSLGSPAEALYCLTDAPTLVITHKNLDNSRELWNKISFKRDWILSSIIQLKGKKAVNYKNIGLTTNHCYTILRLVDVNVEKQTHRLLLLRNPYGHMEWTGNYSDGSKIWTKSLKEAVKFNEKDAGCFWVNLDDYFKLFDHTFLSKYEKNFIYNSYKINKKDIKNETSAFIIKISNENTKNSLIYFTLHQKYKRIYNKKKKNVIANLIISKIENSEEMKIDKNYENLNEFELDPSKIVLQTYCCGNNNKSVNCDAEFENGYYLIISEIHFYDYNDYLTSFILSSYSDKQTKIQLKRIKYFSSQNCLLEKSLISIAQTKCERDLYDDKSYKVISFNNNDSGYGIIYIHNQKTESSIEMNIRFTDFTNLKALNFSFDKDLHLEIPPLKFKLLYFRKLKMRCSFKFKLIENFVFPINNLKLSIKEKGEKKELQLSKANCKVFIYTLTHSRGYLLMVENLNKKTFSGTFKFSKLENLSCSEIKNGILELILKNDEKKFIELIRIDPTQKVAMAHGLSFKLI